MTKHGSEMVGLTLRTAKLGKFKSWFNEFSLSKGYLLWTNQVVIPRELVNAIHEELHIKHPGVVMKCYFWWPGLDADIELLIGSCQLYQETKHNTPCTQILF
ncbi:hypothetical protein PR048_005103 [Dryococelus australis]|uniref:RNA-directed DNA polymerase n=1 Tax=Dryococelus australis TaxID=614101 RepID=A0ABQ9I7R5_9NEOP|nr:hypothetical protein PR048_005103 [Dryococelus australis]